MYGMKTVWLARRGGLGRGITYKVLWGLWSRDRGNAVRVNGFREDSEGGGRSEGGRELKGGRIDVRLSSVGGW